VTTPEDILLLRIGEDEFALPLKDVSHILEADKINILPGAEGPIIGIISSRGEAVVVVDAMAIIASKKETQNRRRPNKGKIIVLKENEVRLGLYIGDIQPSFLYMNDGSQAPEGDDLKETQRKPLKIDWKKLYAKVEVALKESMHE
jgi:chemotaxis signal transduction protein